MKAIDLVPPLMGQDLELAGTVVGGVGGAFTGDEATRRVLRQVGGFPFTGVEDDHSAWAGSAHTNPYDSHRNFLPNGSCLYQDCGHVECCTAEVLGARDHLIAHHGALRLARAAAERANAEMDDGRQIELGVRNSDGFGNSFAAHLSLLLPREAWRNATSQLEAMSWWASALVSMPIYAGQGKVGSELCPQTTSIGYQLSSRAEFFTSFVGYQTTEHRPLINLRNESLAGDLDENVARLHIIFPDSNLCHHAHYLKCGVFQLLGATLQARAWKCAHILADPVAAASTWSADPSLQARVATAKGLSLTALEHQWLICEAAAKFVGTGICDGVVPEAEAIIAVWSETLTRLERQDTPWLARRLDWVLKKQLLESALAEDSACSWDSPALKVLDHRYGLLDESGLYFTCERAGLVEQLATQAEIERSMTEPPAETRAWTRGKLLELASDMPGVIHAVNWDRVVFEFEDESGRKSRFRAALDDPLGFTAETSPIREASTLAEAIHALAAAGLLAEEPHRSRFYYAS